MRGVVNNVKYRLPFWNHPPIHLDTAHSTSSTTHSIATYSFVCRVVEEDGAAIALVVLDDISVFLLLPALCVVMKFCGRIQIRPAKTHRYLNWASSFSPHINFRIPINVR
ncbi:hypothetical protein QQG55_11880 [Brugia pahangi]